jgi:hypothetical protein
LIVLPPAPAASAARALWSIWVEIELLCLWVAPDFSLAYPSLVFAFALVLALTLVLGLVFVSLLSRVAPPLELEHLAGNFASQVWCLAFLPE